MRPRRSGVPNQDATGVQESAEHPEQCQLAGKAENSHEGSEWTGGCAVVKRLSSLRGAE